MSVLSRRLTQLRKQTGQQRANLIAAARTENSVPLRDRLANATAGTDQCKRKISDKDLAEQLGGEVLSEGLIYIANEKPEDQIHGQLNIQSLMQCMLHWPERVDPDIEKMLFIDTETTGLSGGVGTMVFLLGVAEIEQGRVIHHQLLLNGFSGERAMLTWFNQKLTGHTTLVSYNGKSFDVPLLVNRYRMQRLPSPLLTLNHIDLVHWVRRLYKSIWDDCRLISAEKYCLNFYRKDDVDSAEIPAIWTAMIARGNTEKIKPVVQHHHWDVLSLIALLSHLGGQLQNDSHTNINVFTLANYFLRIKEERRALLLLQENRSQLCQKGRFLLATMFRRQKDWKSYLEILNPLADNCHLESIEALAKYYEHIEKDYSQALLFTNRLIQHDLQVNHEKRLNRLFKKQQKNER